MVIKVIRPGEGFVTGGACERNISYVSPLVTLQLRRLEEGLVSIGTYNFSKLLKTVQNKVSYFLTVCKLKNFIQDKTQPLQVLNIDCCLDI